MPITCRHFDLHPDRGQGWKLCPARGLLDPPTFATWTRHGPVHCDHEGMVAMGQIEELLSRAIHELAMGSEVFGLWRKSTDRIDHEAPHRP